MNIYIYVYTCQGTYYLGTWIPGDAYERHPQGSPHPLKDRTGTESEGTHVGFYC